MVYIVIIIKKNKTIICSVQPEKKKWIHYEWWADLRTTAR